MAVTNRQGTGQKPKTKAQKEAAARTAAENSAEVERSINEWRAMQGLPPRSKETRNG